MDQESVNQDYAAMGKLVMQIWVIYRAKPEFDYIAE